VPSGGSVRATALRVCTHPPGGAALAVSAAWGRSRRTLTRERRGLRRPARKRASPDSPRSMGAGPDSASTSTGSARSWLAAELTPRGDRGVRAPCARAGRVLHAAFSASCVVCQRVPAPAVILPRRHAPRNRSSECGVYAYTHIYIHTYIHTYMNACIHTYIHTHTHTHSSHTHTHTYRHVIYSGKCAACIIHACMHTCMHACMHTCIHAYIHTCMQTYTHTHIHTYGLSYLGCPCRFCAKTLQIRAPWSRTAFSSWTRRRTATLS